MREEQLARAYGLGPELEPVAGASELVEAFLEFDGAHEPGAPLPEGTGVPWRMHEELRELRRLLEALALSHAVVRELLELVVAELELRREEVGP